MKKARLKSVDSVDGKPVRADLVPLTGDKLVKDRKQHPIPNDTMYCKLEAVDARSDFRSNTHCARLFGISAAQFLESLEGDPAVSSFDVFIMDIEWPLWEAMALQGIEQNRARFYDSGPEWLEVSYRSDSNLDDGEAYAYPLFLGSAPTFLEIHQMY